MKSILRYLNYCRTIQRNKLIYLWIIPTLRCNLECRHCSAWKYADDSELDLEVLKKNVLSSRIANEAMFILEGGEFFLYRSYEALLRILAGRKYAIFTNGAMTDKIIHACQNYHVSKLIISIDGRPENNMLIRKGSRIEDIAKMLRKIKNKTEVSINYTISDYNSPDDLKWVMGFAKGMNLRLELNVYNKLGYLFCENEEKKIYDIRGLVNNPFVELYNKWLAGKVQIPCVNIRYISSVYPNGNISLCKKKSELVLGNIYQTSLDVIWNSENTRRLQQQHYSCNDCWLKCQRGFDAHLYYRYTRFLPKFFIEKFLRNAELTAKK